MVLAHVSVDVFGHTSVSVCEYVECTQKVQALFNQ